jgi:DNA-binding response OmpR family regulator
MSSRAGAAFAHRRIVVADEDQAVAAMVTKTLRADGNAVFHADDALSAAQLAVALDRCHLFISNTRVEGVAGIDLIAQLRQRQPTLPILYLANLGRSTPELEVQLPADVPILREPFTPDELRALVRALLGPFGAARVRRRPPGAAPADRGDLGRGGCAERGRWPS